MQSINMSNTVSFHEENATQKCSVTVIQLVNAQNSTRPFLQELWNPLVAARVPNFSRVIHTTPFN